MTGSKRRADMLREFSEALCHLAHLQQVSGDHKGNRLVKSYT